MRIVIPILKNNGFSVNYFCFRNPNLKMRDFRSCDLNIIISSTIFTTPSDLIFLGDVYHNMHAKQTHSFKKTVRKLKNEMQ